ncbi:MAG: Gfo/Idh/MocA family oxidoreductase [Acidimicrobiales bacterium]
MRVTVIGSGATGARAARALRRLQPTAELVLVDRHRSKAELVAAQLGSGVRARSFLREGPPPDAVVLCVPAGAHEALAVEALQLRCPRGVHRRFGGRRARLAHPGARGRAQGAPTGGGGRLLARPELPAGAARRIGRRRGGGAWRWPSRARVGPIAPASTMRLVAPNWEWRDGQWLRRRGSSGRRLVWFPDLIGPLDCYRAGLPEPFLLQRSFPDVRRITARMAATRRDRSPAGCRCCGPPHADGGPGGLLVELWGRRGGVAEVVVYGAADNPATVAGTMAAVAVAQGDRVLPPAGACGYSDCRDPVAVLATLRELGIEVSTFEGAA